jgi:hypothetical protein
MARVKAAELAKMQTVTNLCMMLQHLQHGQGRPRALLAVDQQPEAGQQAATAAVAAATATAEAV